MKCFVVKHLVVSFSIFVHGHFVFSFFPLDLVFDLSTVATNANVISGRWARVGWGVG
jgi:hypothetical protein